MAWSVWRETAIIEEREGWADIIRAVALLFGKIIRWIHSFCSQIDRQGGDDGA